MIKQYIGRIIDGILLGLGFSIPLSLAYILVTVYTTDVYLDRYAGDTSQPNYGLEIGDTRIEKVDDKFMVLGRITNPMSSDISGVKIDAEFFGNDGLFIEKCTGTLSGELRAEATRNFRIRCKGPEFNYNSFTVSVVYVSRF